MQKTEQNCNYDYPSAEEVLGKKYSNKYIKFPENDEPFGIDDNLNQNGNNNLSQPFIPNTNFYIIKLPQNVAGTICKYCGKSIIPKQVNSASFITHVAAGIVCLFTSVCCLCICLTPLVYSCHCFETSDIQCPNCHKCIN